MHFWACQRRSSTAAASLPSGMPGPGSNKPQPAPLQLARTGHLHRTGGAAHRPPTSAGSAAAAGSRGSPAGPAAAAPAPARAGLRRRRAAWSTPAVRGLRCAEPLQRGQSRLRGREAAWFQPHTCAFTGARQEVCCNLLKCATMRTAACEQSLLQDTHQELASGSAAQGLQVCGVCPLADLAQPIVQHRRTAQELHQARKRFARRSVRQLLAMRHVARALGRRRAGCALGRRLGRLHSPTRAQWAANYLQRWSARRAQPPYWSGTASRLQPGAWRPRPTPQTRSTHTKALPPVGRAASVFCKSLVQSNLPQAGRQGGLPAAARVRIRQEKSRPHASAARRRCSPPGPPTTPPGLQPGHIRCTPRTCSQRRGV